MCGGTEIKIHSWETLWETLTPHEISLSCSRESPHSCWRRRLRFVLSPRRSASETGGEFLLTGNVAWRHTHLHFLHLLLPRCCRINNREVSSRIKEQQRSLVGPPRVNITSQSWCKILCHVCILHLYSCSMFHVSEREISIIITCLEMFFGAVARRFDCK